MRREIIATRRAGVTTSVVKEIAPKGAHHTIAHDWKDAGTRFDSHKKLEGNRQKPKELESLRIISTTSEKGGWFI